MARKKTYKKRQQKPIFPINAPPGKVIKNCPKKHGFFPPLSPPPHPPSLKKQAPNGGWGKKRGTPQKTVFLFLTKSQRKSLFCKKRKRVGAPELGKKNIFVPKKTHMPKGTRFSGKKKKKKVKMKNWGP